MAWRDNLRPASFRGAPFFVDMHRADGGRRVAVHEFPGRDKPQTEDLGGSARRFAVEAYVLGPEYMAAAQQLQAALDAIGPAVLVVPWLEPVRAQVVGYSRAEATSEGGIARFSIGLVETDAEFAIEAPDPIAQAQGAASALGKAAKLGFLASLLEKGVPQFVRDALGAGVLSVVDAIGAAPILSATEDALDLALALDALSSGAYDGSLSAQLSADNLLLAMPLIGPVFGKGRNALRALERVMRIKRPTPKAQGAMGKAAEANQTAVLTLAGLAAAGEAVAIAAEAPWDSYQEALEWRDLIAALIGDLEAEAPDEAWQALGDVRRALGEAVPPPLTRLPQVALWTPPEAVPAELVAYQVFGNAAAGLDIAKRNRLPRPLVAPAEPLEVLIP